MDDKYSYGELNGYNTYGEHPTEIKIVDSNGNGDYKIVLYVETDYYSATSRGNNILVYDVSSREIQEYRAGTNPVGELVYIPEKKIYGMRLSSLYYHISDRLYDMDGNELLNTWLYMNSEGGVDYEVNGEECTEEKYKESLDNIQKYQEVEMTDCSEFSVVDFMDYIKDGLKNVGVY